MELGLHLDFPAYAWLSCLLFVYIAQVKVMTYLVRASPLAALIKHPDDRPDIRYWGLPDEHPAIEPVASHSRRQ